MRKIMAYLCVILASLVLCCITLFVPLGTEMLWYHPCVNVYSLFAVAFFVMNTFGLCMFSRGSNVFAKPYTKEQPMVEERKNYVTALVLAFFEAPLLLPIFFVDGGWKMMVCSTLFLGGSMILGGLIGDMSVIKMRARIREQERCELAEQLRKEQA